MNTLLQDQSRNMPNKTSEDDHTTSIVTTFEKKCWGFVSHDFSNEVYCTSHLEVMAGWRSSIHLHEKRTNVFCCVDAEIIVELFGLGKQPTFSPTYAFRMVAGDAQRVAPMVWHRFRVIQDGRIVELYFTDRDVPCSIDDIVRHDEGGKDDS